MLYTNHFSYQMGATNNYGTLVLNIPHASTHVPDSLFHGERAELDKYLRQRSHFVDYFTDALFMPDEPNESIRPVVSTVNRNICDVERLPHDPLESEGNGIMPPPFSQSCKVVLDRVKIYDYYLDYQNLLAKSLNTAHQLQPLLIDCHSFSSSNPLIENHEKADEIDICVGFNDDFSYPGDCIVGSIIHYFENLGYKVGCNTPFSNSKTVETPFPYHSLMLEVNKRLYMDEATGERIHGFEHLHAAILRLSPLLLHECNP